MPPTGAQPAATPNTLPPSHSKLSEQDRAELAALDAAVARIKKVTPSDPYIITVPQDPKLKDAYHHHYKSQQFQWLHNAPFRMEEGEGMQYQTFNFQEPDGEHIMALHANPLTMSRPPTADPAKSTTRPNTPNPGPKKVLSLSAYKNKQAGGTPAQEKAGVTAPEKASKQPAVKGPAERLKAESAEMLAALGTPESSQTLPSERKEKAAPEPVKASAKRKREDEPAADREQPKTNGDRTVPPPKKTRTEEPVPVAEKVDKLKTQSAAPAKHAQPKSRPAASQQRPNELLPPKLSPVRNSPFELPERVTYELPANIEEGLKERTKAEPTTTSKDTSKRTAPEPKPRKESSLAPDASGVASANKSPKPSGGEGSGPKSPAVTPAKIAKDRAPPKPAAREPAKTSGSTAAPKTTEAEPESEASLVVKLKYKKARREDIRRILRLSPRPSKPATRPSPPTEAVKKDSAEPVRPEKTVNQPVDRRDATRRTGKGVAQKIGPATKKPEETRATGEKRPRTEPDLDEETEPVAKRSKLDQPAAKTIDSAVTEATSKKKKVPDALELKKTPSTPQANLQSPSLTNGHRSQLVTPSTRKDLLLTSAAREASADSQANTPSAKSNTPTINGHGSNTQNGTSQRPPSSQPSSKTPQQQAWDAEFSRLNALGRELKHSAQDDLKEKRAQCAAVKLVECLLCYILAFACSDEAALSADPKRSPDYRPWKTLMAFYGFVRDKTKDFPVLSGLAASLAAVFNNRIVDLLPATDETWSNATTAAKRAAIEADEKLDIDTLMETFPKAWKGRTKGLLPTDARPEPKKMLAGAYKLPLGQQSSAVPAVRAGVAILREYMEKEKIGYELRVTA